MFGKMDGKWGGTQIEGGGGGKVREIHLPCFFRRMIENIEINILI
jgi:hypothetical protein